MAKDVEQDLQDNQPEFGLHILDQDLFVREGDFILYGDFFYELVTLKEPKQLFGQIDHRIEISAKAIRAREGLFDATW